MRRIVVIGVLAALAALSNAPLARATSGDEAGGRIRDDLARAMSRRSAEAELDVIVSFRGVSSEAGAARARQAIGSFETAYSYETIPAVAARLSVGQIRALAARPEVVEIQLDAPVELMLESATRDFGTDKAVIDFGVDGNNESGACPGAKSYCADDVVIAVLDSGISNGHLDLDNGKVIKYVDCTLDPCGSGGVDTDGHGTHVASIAAGEGEANAANAGVAPGAALVSVKVAGSYTTVSWMDRGIEWVLQNHAQYGIDVLNLSAGTTTSSDGTDTTSRLINRAAAAGIVPVVAAGNSGTKGLQQIGAPAAAKYAATVGAMNDSGGVGKYEPLGWNLWISSSRGPTLDGRVKPDLVAPGVQIDAAGLSSSTSYVSKTGTSMSSPFVAGVAALMLDADPTLRPGGTACSADDVSTDCSDGVVDSSMSTRLKDLLTGTADDWGPSGADNHYGAGALDAYAAVDAASPVAASTAPPAPFHVYAEGSLSGTGAVADHPVAVSATDWPVSVTMVMPGAFCGSGCVNPDFEISILDPAGTVVATPPVTNHYHENAAVKPSVTGTYVVRVRSVSGAGPYWLDVAYPGTVPAITMPPSDPSNLTAAPVSGSISQIDLSWANVSGESGYKVERSPDGMSSWAQIATTSTDVATYRDSGLAMSTTYYYRVRAYNSVGDSAYSNTASAKTNADTTAPTTPTNVKASGGRGKVTLTWTASTDSGGSGLAGYKVFRSTSSTGTYTHVGTTTTTSYTDTAVTKGKVYYYYVVAYDNAGNHSAASAKVSAKPS